MIFKTCVSSSATVKLFPFFPFGYKYARVIYLTDISCLTTRKLAQAWEKLTHNVFRNLEIINVKIIYKLFLVLYHTSVMLNLSPFFVNLLGIFKFLPGDTEWEGSFGVISLILNVYGRNEIDLATETVLSRSRKHESSKKSRLPERTGWHCC